MEKLRRWQSSRKAYRAKLHRIVAEKMDFSEAIDDSKLDSLSTSVKKLQ